LEDPFSTYSICKTPCQWQERCGSDKKSSDTPAHVSRCCTNKTRLDVVKGNICCGAIEANEHSC
tara:strand:+ start:254 stop:445 length:192 start_codon:yes stop_codon:yes gene_type:complete